MFWWESMSFRSERWVSKWTMSFRSERSDSGHKVTQWAQTDRRRSASKSKIRDLLTVWSTIRNRDAQTKRFFADSFQPSPIVDVGNQFVLRFRCRILRSNFSILLMMIFFSIKQIETTADYGSVKHRPNIINSKHQRPSALLKYLTNKREIERENIFFFAFILRISFFFLPLHSHTHTHT